MRKSITAEIVEILNANFSNDEKRNKLLNSAKHRKSTNREIIKIVSEFIYPHTLPFHVTPRVFLLGNIIS